MNCFLGSTAGFQRSPYAGSCYVHVELVQHESTISSRYRPGFSKKYSYPLRAPENTGPERNLPQKTLTSYRQAIITRAWRSMNGREYGAKIPLNIIATTTLIFRHQVAQTDEMQMQ